MGQSVTVKTPQLTTIFWCNLIYIYIHTHTCCVFWRNHSGSFSSSLSTSISHGRTAWQVNEWKYRLTQKHKVIATTWSRQTRTDKDTSSSNYFHTQSQDVLESPKCRHPNSYSESFNFFLFSLSVANVCGTISLWISFRSSQYQPVCITWLGELMWSVLVQSF